MLCTFQRDETTGDSCQCPAVVAPVCSLFEAFTEWSTRNVSMSLKPSADTMLSVKPTVMRAIIARTRVGDIHAPALRDSVERSGEDLGCR
jgi:hypothetical protein